MGLEHIAGGGLFAYGAAGTLVMESLPHRGQLLTASLTGVTDSAAGATALATGQKTWNDVVGMDRDFAPLTTVLEDARARGLAVGVVTTDTLTGATPASFFAHTENRGNREDIAAQLVASAPDVVFGGGGADLGDLLASADVQLVTTATELSAVVRDGRPLFGVFAESTFPYVADGYGDQPSLAEMTRHALDALEEDPDGFFLVVEGSRIDHASHGNDGERVHQETAAFDDAVGAAVTWASEGGFDPTLVVTADHECGGLEVSGGGSAGVVPASEWRWGQHTNADVAVFGSGPHTDVLHEQRLDNTWVHAVLAAAVADADRVTGPATRHLADGRTDDLGPVIVTQVWETDFGVGYNQLDALRISADEFGLWVGVDGVFEVGENAVVLLVDVDFGEGTGLGAEDSFVEDETGLLDSVISRIPLAIGVEGLGFDLAFGAVGAEEVAVDEVRDVGGLRGLSGAWGGSGDYWWLYGTSNFDHGNLSGPARAEDAAGTGLTENGWEVWLPWAELYPSGLPPEGLSLGVVAVLVNEDGTYVSNQALPPLETGSGSGEGVILLPAAVRLDVDASGLPLGAASVTP
jgi:alkaline phosphatase